FRDAARTPRFQDEGQTDPETEGQLEQGRACKHHGERERLTELMHARSFGRSAGGASAAKGEAKPTSESASRAGQTACPQRSRRPLKELAEGCGEPLGHFPSGVVAVEPVQRSGRLAAVALGMNVSIEKESVGTAGRSGRILVEHRILNIGPRANVSLDNGD